ncbi:MAG: thioredoxin family protein [Saprospiraceae bacterium]|nr:thioredoxin family protein [Saprospiraceae bacterium]
MKIFFPVMLIIAVLFAMGCNGSRQITMAGPGMKFSLNHQDTAQDGTPMLLGRIDRKGLLQAPFSEWFNAEYASYQVNTAAAAPLQGKFTELDIEIFMGTWCEDSQREVPRFFKILDQLGVDEQRLRMYSLDDHPDRRKTSPQGEEKGKNIEYVPTFIFSRAGQEIGRIVESPQMSLEADMAAILSK